MRQISMGEEFVEYDNRQVSMVLHKYPEILGDILHAIGQTYLHRTGNGSLVPVLDRRARVLARLRTTKNPIYNLESMLLMVCGLCALELLDTRPDADGSSIPVFVAYAAALVSQSAQLGLQISPLARFLVRSVARQDMIIALMKRRRPLVKSTAWLDDDARRSADRFMGYTMTFMPLLEELSTLAEEVKQRYTTLRITNGEQGSSNLQMLSPDQLYRFSYRSNDLRARIDAWRPVLPPSSSFRSSQKFFLQAYAYRSAALLYLHHLLYPPQSSSEADDVALNMAYDVMSHLHGTDAEMRMFLWPTFVAGCELKDDEDRSTILDVLEKIYRGRGLTTVLRTRMFLRDRVWKAMDDGEYWNWTSLIDSYPGELTPL